MLALFLKILLTPVVVIVFRPVAVNVLASSILRDYCNPTKHAVFYFAMFLFPTQKESTTPNLVQYEIPLILDHNHSQLH